MKRDRWKLFNVSAKHVGIKKRHNCNGKMCFYILTFPETDVVDMNEKDSSSWLMIKLQLSFITRITPLCFYRFCGLFVQRNIVS